MLVCTALTCLFTRISTDTSKVFCPYCGNATLARLGLTISKTGKVYYHYKKDRRVNTRGTKVRCGWLSRVARGKGACDTCHMARPRAHRVLPLRRAQFSLPKPKGGRGGDLLLAEDQMMVGVWAQRVKKKESINSFFADTNGA